MKKLMEYLKERYDVSDHIDLNEDKCFTQLYIELTEAYVEIFIEYNAKEDWSVTKDDGHGGFEIGYELTNGSISVHSVGYYIKDGQIPISKNDKEDIETELNEQLQKALP